MMSAPSQGTNFNVGDRQPSDIEIVEAQDRVIATKREQAINGTSLEVPVEAESVSLPEQSKIIEFPRPSLQRTSRAYFKTLHQWQGYVIEKEGESFRARIRDLTSPEMPEEEIVLDIADITDESDVELLEPGAVFYLIIGYNIQNRRRVRSSYLYFRRTVVWTRSEIEKMKRSAEEFAQLLESEES